MVNTIYNFIGQHTLAVGIFIVALFILFKVLTRKRDPIKKDNVINDLQPAAINSNNIITSGEQQDTATKRIGRGFKTMMEKARNSEYLQNMVAENSNPNPESMLPPELTEYRDGSEDQFSTNFSNLKKIDF